MKKATNTKQTQSPYQRILIIDQLIASGTYPDDNKIKKELEHKSCKGGTSRATIFRDLNTLREDFKAPLVFNKEKKGYEYSDKTFRIPALFTTQEQIQAARLIRNLLDAVKGTPLYEDSKKVFDTLSTVAPVRNSLGESIKETSLNETENDSKRIVFMGANHVAFSSDTWKTVKTAVEKNQLISFDYKALYEDESSRRTIEPWQLVFFDGEWFVWGNDYYDYIVKLFSVGSIQNIELRKEKYVLPKDFDFRNTTPGTFGCYTNPKYKTYKIRFTGMAAKKVMNRVWGRNQKKKINDDDSLILTFESNQHEPIMNWIMSWGKDAIPMQPKDVIKIWKENISQAYNVMK